ncbi:glycosyl hydrolase family 18 protein [Micromonospora sp. LOL_023]|uniref:glycosyl hydrolase family 18 protein n=1 Tax=Micromonospora sp. LOL_023 TaxID=3345418 RepID=UPI003A8684DB
MRRSLRRAMWAGALAVVTAAAAVPVTAAFGAGTISAGFVATSDWGTGHEVRVTVANGSDASVSTWRIEFDLPAGTTIGSFWDADVTRSGTHYTAVKKSWAGSLAPGTSFSWGYVGTGAYRAPTNCTVNGVSCAGGPAPTTAPPTTAPPTTPPPTTQPPPPGGQKVVGYFTQWGVYGRNYHVRNIHTSGSAAKMTHILYAFGNTTGGRCTIGESYADYEKAYPAAESVDGVADTWDQPLRGNFNQLRKLKAMYPHLKVIWSFGGWTWSGGFTQAAQNPAAFAESCHNLVEDPRWADVFDGIDIDWEYPNACGLTCDASGPNAFKNVVSALRTRFGSSALVTAAITADGSNGGKIDATDYAGAAGNLNWIMPMTYDYFGAFNAQGPTAPHSPLTSYAGIPQQGFWSDAAIQKLKSKGIPANKLLLGIGFYGRGWTGVSQTTPGGTATGAAPGTYEQGIEDYKVLKNTCPVTGTVGGTAYAKCGSNWWSYDTPATIGGKMSYARGQGLGGAFFWELSGDTGNGELVAAIRNGLG